MEEPDFDAGISGHPSAQMPDRGAGGAGGVAENRESGDDSASPEPTSPPMPVDRATFITERITRWLARFPAHVYLVGKPAACAAEAAAIVAQVLDHAPDVGFDHFVDRVTRHLDRERRSRFAPTAHEVAVACAVVADMDGASHQSTGKPAWFVTAADLVRP